MAHSLPNDWAPAYLETDSQAVVSDKRAGKKRGRDKGMVDRSHDDENGEGKSGKRQKKGEAPARLVEEPEIRFACPYYKRNTRKYSNSRICAGPGWPTVHRMKEHIYTYHAQPPHCPQCYAIFRSGSRQIEHMQSSKHCVRPNRAVPPEGINKEQKITLKNRRAPMQLEEEKWRSVYLVLFPGTAPHEIPSPYFDSNEDEILEPPVYGLPRQTKAEPTQPSASHKPSSSFSGPESLSLHDLRRLVTKSEMNPSASTEPPSSSSGPAIARKPDDSRERIKYTISTDGTTCEVARHKLLFMALTGSAKYRVFGKKS